MEHKIVGREAWLAARKELLAQEKALDKERDRLSKARRALPWVKVEKQYEFESETGKESLRDLFGNKRQLAVYHFMFGPDWEEGCPSCSYLTDHYQGAIEHLAARDVALVAVSRGPLNKLIAFRKRMGWRHKWVSSGNTDFNQDFHVSFTEAQIKSGKVCYNYKEQAIPMNEMPGFSAFYKDDSGNIFHTYSTYGRGLDRLINTYNFLDLMPKGRDEDELEYTMAWVRHHDKYES